MHDLEAHAYSLASSVAVAPLVGARNTTKLLRCARAREGQSALAAGSAWMRLPLPVPLVKFAAVAAVETPVKDAPEA